MDGFARYCTAPKSACPLWGRIAAYGALALGLGMMLLGWQMPAGM